MKRCIDLVAPNGQALSEWSTDASPKDLIEVTKWAIESYEVFEALSVRLEEIQHTTEDNRACAIECGWAILGHLRRAMVADNSAKKTEGRPRAFDEAHMAHVVLCNL